MKRLLLAVFAFALTVVPARGSGVETPQARAWVLRISAPGAGDIVTVADASTIGDPAAVPIAIAGHSISNVVATAGAPDVKAALKDYDDPTGSLSMQSVFSEAHVAPDSRSARAGLDSLTGSGFALANKYFTFDQQAQLLAQWKQLNDMIFVPLNNALGSLGAPLGLKIPLLSGISPVGLIDVVGAQEVAASADTASSPGFSSAHADAAAASVKLFGGFIEIDGVRATAVSESVAGTDTRTAKAMVGRVLIAGIEVAVDSNGIHVAGNDLLPTSLLAPVLDPVFSTLAAAGISIRTVAATVEGDKRTADVLQISAAGLLFSIGHAEASAPAAFAVLAPPVTVHHRPIVPPVEVKGTKYVRRVVVTPIVPPVVVQPAEQPATRRRAPFTGSFLRFVYLIFVGGGLAAAVGYPLWIGRARRRGAPEEGALA